MSDFIAEPTHNTGLERKSQASELEEIAVQDKVMSDDIETQQNVLAVKPHTSFINIIVNVLSTILEKFMLTVNRSLQRPALEVSIMGTAQILSLVHWHRLPL